MDVMDVLFGTHTLQGQEIHGKGPCKLAIKYWDTSYEDTANSRHSRNYLRTTVVLICKAMQSTLQVWEAEHLQILFLGWVGCGHETNPICVDNNTHSDILLMPTCTQQILINNGSTHTKTSPSSMLEQAINYRPPSIIRHSHTETKQWQKLRNTTEM